MTNEQLTQEVMKLAEHQAKCDAERENMLNVVEDIKEDVKATKSLAEDVHIMAINMKNMQETLLKTPNLTIKEAMVEDLIIEDNVVKGVVTATGEKIGGKTVILTTGTYLKGNILIGSENTPGGPHGEARSNYLSDKLKEYGLKILRLKTGTPQRIKKDSID